MYNSTGYWIHRKWWWQEILSRRGSNFGQIEGKWSSLFLWKKNLIIQKSAYWSSFFYTKYFFLNYIFEELMVGLLTVSTIWYRLLEKVLWKTSWNLFTNLIQSLKLWVIIIFYRHSFWRVLAMLTEIAWSNFRVLYQTEWWWCEDSSREQLWWSSPGRVKGCSAWGPILILEIYLYLIYEHC